MEMFKPIKHAIKELDQFLFIKRVTDVYKNPEIGKIKQQYELWIFAGTLVLIPILIYVCINLFPDYFLFNPDKHFNPVKLTLVLIKNALVPAISISLMSGIIFNILGIKNITSYIGLIFLRVIYVFALTLILLSAASVIEFNNILKSGSYIPNFNQSLFLLLLVFCWVFLIFRMLFMPMYQIVKLKSKLIRVLSVVFILLCSTIINHYVSTLFPTDFFLNTQEFLNGF